MTTDYSNDKLHTSTIFEDITFCDGFKGTTAELIANSLIHLKIGKHQPEKITINKERKSGFINITKKEQKIIIFILYPPKDINTYYAQKGTRVQDLSIFFIKILKFTIAKIIKFTKYLFYLYLSILLINLYNSFYPTYLVGDVGELLLIRSSF